MGPELILTAIALFANPATLTGVDLIEVIEEGSGISRFQHPYLKAGRLSEHIVLSVHVPETTPELSLQIRTWGDERIGLKSAIVTVDSQRWRLSAGDQGAGQGAQHKASEETGEQFEWFNAGVSASVRGILEKIGAADVATVTFVGGKGKREHGINGDEKKHIREVLVAYDKMLVTYQKRAERAAAKAAKRAAKRDKKLVELNEAAEIIKCQSALEDPTDRAKSMSECGGYLKAGRLKTKKK